MRCSAVLLALTALACGEGDDRPIFAPDAAEPVSRGRADAGVGHDVSSAFDPCARCAPSALCISGECRCPLGSEGNGFVCSDVDECASNPCDPRAICANTEGGFTCQCRAGYAGDGRTCEPVACEPCDEDGRCGSGRCLQRYCDGRFGCYESDGCGSIGGAACTASGAWQACEIDDDCPADHHPGGVVTLEFRCEQRASDAGKRCWPYLQTSYGNTVPAPITERVSCPPVPAGVTGARVVKDPHAVNHCPPPPQPCEQSSAPLPTYERCALSCSTASSCPHGMRCRSGRCE